VRTAYKVRAYPNPGQAALLARTFGCVRVVWNRTLADRRAVYAAFFAKRARYPRFKSRGGRQSAEYTRSAFGIRDGQLWLAKDSEPLRIAWSWPHVDLDTINPTSVTVSREPDGRYFVSFAVDVPDPGPLPTTGEAVGVDVGLKSFAVLSTGERVAHSRVADARRDFLHKTSTDLVARFDVIAVEDLNVAGMVRNRSLAKSISETGWGQFRELLTYKAAWAGRRLVVIDRWYPSSKTCSACGQLLASLSLGTRTWQCPGCGTRHDRDLNAAKNIRAAGPAAGP
jgi:putative transposase